MLLKRDLLLQPPGQISMFCVIVESVIRSLFPEGRGPR